MDEGGGCISGGTEGREKELLDKQPRLRKAEWLDRCKSCFKVVIRRGLMAGANKARLEPRLGGGMTRSVLRHRSIVCS